MCGICGVYGARPDLPGTVIESMALALRHRGPDAQSWKRLDSAELGHARLSIIDLDGGSQPMSDPSDRYWIITNGEIYNYRELREELVKEGQRFRTCSDTEVILAAYLQWGAGCLDRFRGMFAFAIWDATDRELFAARDLFGEKPLYYALAKDGALLLASEIKAISASGLLTPIIDPHGVDAYLGFGYLPPDRTIYENVYTLPPAHYLRWNAPHGVRLSRYWRPVFAPEALSLPDAAARLRCLLEQAVRRQMVADVPVGAFLSGGHDSSTIVALMQRQSSRPVRTFSVGFGDAINELPYARAVAQHYRTEHHDIDLGEPPVAELLERMADVYDEPFKDPSHVPTYLLSQYARRYVKVALSGDGADELFGGYGWYLLHADSITVSDSLLVRFVSRAVSQLIGNRFGTLARRSLAMSQARRWPEPWSRFVNSRLVFDEGQRRTLWGSTGAYRPYFPDGYYLPGADAAGMDRVLHFDLLTFLPGDILVKVDRAAMAHGLETRAPFLDRDLVEFALALPVTMKVRDGQTKVLFKQALHPLWPAVVRTRGKQGFEGPYRRWLARDDVQSILRRVFDDASALRGLLPGLSPGIPRERNRQVWSLMTLGLWLERHPGTFRHSVPTPRGEFAE
jgi:asparagine synthase (glutamine-hydrolysing)